MESTTRTRLAQAAAEYDRAIARMGYAPLPERTRQRLPSIKLMRSPGAAVTVAPPNDESPGWFHGNSTGGNEWTSDAAYAAGRTLERCIVEHRFGRKEPVTHKFYTADGEVRLTKAQAAAVGHNFPESTPWLP